jgi:feruloyl-CoA synthase
MMSPSHALQPDRPLGSEIEFAPVEVTCEKLSGGGFLLRSRRELEPHDPSLARMFRHAVERAPQRVFLAERDGERWRELTYAQARSEVDAVAQALIDRGLSAERPLMILSGNSLEHAILMLAGFSAGVPVAPISVAYSLQSQDHAKLREITRLLEPGLVYVSDTAPFAKALAAIAPAGIEIAAGKNGAGLPNVTAFAEVARSKPGPTVEAAVARGNAQTIAKFLLTSGSTGTPKAVVNTHGMLAANQQALAQVWPFLERSELVLLDWLPWNHTFGGNHNFNLVLRRAGTLYIDAGKPMPALIGETVRNLREVSPTIYFNVPAGYGALLPYLESDEALAKRFFARLELIFYAAAALPQDLWDRIESLALRTTGRRVPMTSAWGATETSPLATAAHFPIDRPGVIGVPVPGIELKLVPAAGKLEIRVRGPHVTPGYWKNAELTTAAFDEDGFYRIGDAVRFAVPDDPARGLLFDGRTAEDFKLVTGVWVHTGALRVGALAAASPALQDCVVAGEGRDSAGLLAWLNAAGCQRLIGAQSPPSLPDLARHPAIGEHVRKGFAKWNAEKTGSSMRISRVLLLDDAPSIDAGEITDKGYINQRLTLERRAAAVERLFAKSPGPDVIVISDD